MPQFRARNSYYLRISEKNVLPLFVYLDERHLEWMSDIILQHVISDLRPKILDKLRAESDMKPGGSSTTRGTVETHRGENYQFCYFLRRTEPHSVVIKSRDFKAVPAQRKPTLTVPEPTNVQATKPTRRKKRKTPPIEDHQPDEDTSSSRSKRRRPQRTKVSTETAPMVIDDASDSPVEDDDAYEPPSSDDELLPVNKFKKSTRKRRNARRNSSSDESVGIDESSPMDLVVEDEEEKPKPVLELKYKGFNLFGRCLCVVVEPWPHFQYTMTGAASLAPIFERNSLTPGPGDTSQTPLFLPDDDDNGRSTTLNRQPRPHPLFNNDTITIDDDDDDDNDGGMMAFSQALNNTGDYRAMAAEEDDDGIEEVFFGDADERREI